MPVVILKCVPQWYPPEDVEESYGYITPYQQLTLNLKAQLPGIFCTAVLDADRGTELTPSQVHVHLELMHPDGENSCDIQLIAFVGGGSSGYEPGALRERTTEISEGVEDGLTRLQREWADMNTEAVWPDMQLELLPVMMVGFAMTREGQISARWGRPSEAI